MRTAKVSAALTQIHFSFRSNKRACHHAIAFVFWHTHPRAFAGIRCHSHKIKYKNWPKKSFWALRICTSTKGEIIIQLKYDLKSLRREGKISKFSLREIMNSSDPWWKFLFSANPANSFWRQRLNFQFIAYYEQKMREDESLKIKKITIFKSQQSS